MDGSTSSTRPTPPSPPSTRFVDIGIVAHIARLADAQDLAEQTSASFVGIDDGALGCDANHRRTWKQLAHSNSVWSVVLEDDAIPVHHFLDQLRPMLHNAPTPIVSLYLGTSRPPQWQEWMKQAIARAEAKKACYIVAPKLFHAVGVAIRTPLVSSMVAHTGSLKVPIDEAISSWAQRQHQQVAYCWPCLVDHRDGPTVALHRDRIPRTDPRKAWAVGTRPRWYPSAV